MIPIPQRGTAIYGGQRLLAFRTARAISPSVVAATVERQAVVLKDASHLPGRLAEFIRQLFAYEVIWHFRIENDRIYFSLPSTHIAAGMHLTAMQILDLFCQAACRLRGISELTVDLAQTKTNDCYPLGSVGVTLEQIIDWACSA